MYTIDNLCGIPVYEQIIRQTETFILTGILGQDSPMPSVRAVAAEIAANPNTIQKAYTNMLGRGIIYAVPGKGSFISADAHDILRAELEKELATVERMAAQFTSAGIDKQAVIAAVERGYDSV